MGGGYILGYAARTLFTSQAHQPIDPVFAEARCVVTGYGLNKITVC